MAALNPPGSLPSEAEVIVGLLINAKDRKLARQYVDRVVTPSSLTPGAADGSVVTESETLAVCRSTGLVRREGEELLLGDSLAAQLTKGSGRPLLRTTIRRTFFATVSPEDARSSNEGAGDLARAAAWFLLQDIWAPKQGWEGAQGWEDLQGRQLKKEDQPLINATRWGALDRWLPYLGLAVHDHRDSGGRSSVQVLVPDPTAAVREELRVILEKVGAEAPLKVVLAKLAAACPVLDGGMYSGVVRDRILPGTLTNAPDVVSPSLSHALRRLHDSKDFELLDRGDAEKERLSTLGEPIPFSHLVRRAS
jgi:hypothetical protein